jgi:hypothetical protein
MLEYTSPIAVLMSSSSASAGAFLSDEWDHKIKAHIGRIADEVG